MNFASQNAPSAGSTPAPAPVAAPAAPAAPAQQDTSNVAGQVAQSNNALAQRGATTLPQLTSAQVMQDPATYQALLTQLTNDRVSPDVVTGLALQKSFQQMMHNMTQPQTSNVNSLTAQGVLDAVRMQQIQQQALFGGGNPPFANQPPYPGAWNMPPGPSAPYGYPGYNAAAPFVPPNVNVGYPPPPSPYPQQQPAYAPPPPQAAPAPAAPAPAQPQAVAPAPAAAPAKPAEQPAATPAASAPSNDLMALIKENFDKMQKEIEGLRTAQKMNDVDGQLKNFDTFVSSSGVTVSGVEKLRSIYESCLRSGEYDKAKEVMSTVEQCVAQLQQTQRVMNEYQTKAAQAEQEMQRALSNKITTTPVVVARASEDNASAASGNKRSREDNEPEVASKSIDATGVHRLPLPQVDPRIAAWVAGSYDQYTKIV